MKLSVPFNFDNELIKNLSKIPEVRELYGKMTTDYIGGGRSNYTFQNIKLNKLKSSVIEAHKNGLQFNYLLNAASLYGMEQTRSGQRKIRQSLDTLEQLRVDSITVASPYLLRIIKNNYPQFKVKAGAFAVIDSPLKAKQWEDSGADVLCISAIACNRNFEILREIRESVKCECMLIANALCIQSCSYELTHMHILSNSSRKNDPLKGYCVDYCFFNCSKKRLLEPVNYIKSIWIRPEDLILYENLGYSTFKLVERSCPSKLILKRASAYANRSFEGNLMELIAPVASIKKELNASVLQRIKMFYLMFKPTELKLSSLLLMKKFAEKVLIHDFSKESAGVYIDNNLLNGYLNGLLSEKCSGEKCFRCSYCENWAKKVVTYKNDYRSELLSIAEKIDQELINGSFF